jgi:hypothetical protein
VTVQRVPAISKGASGKAPLIKSNLSAVSIKEHPQWFVKQAVESGIVTGWKIGCRRRLRWRFSCVPCVYREPFAHHAEGIAVTNLKPYASTLLTVCGIILMGMGLYFALIRPELLPEDILYAGLSSQQLQATAPGLLNWLDKVFWVMGGYMFASGLLICYVAQTTFRERRRGVLSVVGVAGLSSLGLMVIINFLIDSNFKWLLLVFAALWLTALGLFLRQKWINPIYRSLRVTKR